MQVFGRNWASLVSNWTSLRYKEILSDKKKAFRFFVTTEQAAENLEKKSKLIKLGWIPNDSPAKISNNCT